ncbi:hypothetical protein GCM10008955_09400 [Deinococcus malanensis]|uniref:Uncharacterized protein n=1 Tax=Deinococcus malanensis TaxID=1706855 RepID=A0ABQ2EN50_9DEIO|nr:hypothetical protein [Deinococcus malanensis]GGK18093.1 hypothetical protein GCM10008955_09400 [Deinococcus malanensis]
MEHADAEPGQTFNARREHDGFRHVEAGFPTPLQPVFALLGQAPSTPAQEEETRAALLKQLHTLKAAAPDMFSEETSSLLTTAAFMTNVSPDDHYYNQLLTFLAEEYRKLAAD